MTKIVTSGEAEEMGGRAGQESRSALRPKSNTMCHRSHSLAFPPVPVLSPCAPFPVCGNASAMGFTPAEIQSFEAMWQPGPQCPTGHAGREITHHATDEANTGEYYVKAFCPDCGMMLFTSQSGLDYLLSQSALRDRAEST